MKEYKKETLAEAMRHGIVHMEYLWTTGYGIHPMFHNRYFFNFTKKELLHFNIVDE